MPPAAPAPAERRALTVLFCDLVGSTALSQRIAGFAGPLRVWQVGGDRVTSRFRALHTASVPLLGRADAMAKLVDLWEAAQTGGGRAALVQGEAGIGKSRLVLELTGHVRRRAAAVLRFQCSPRREGSMLHPILDRLQHAAGRAAATRPAPRRRACGGCCGAGCRPRTAPLPCSRI